MLPRHSRSLLQESEVREILTRAADLDSSGERPLSLAELRDIAAEAHISPHALERAIQEARLGWHGRAARTAPRVPWRNRLLRAAGLFAAGAALAAVVHGIDPRGMGSEAATFFMSVSGAFALVRGFMHRFRGSLAAYQRELGVLFLGSACVLGGLQGVDALQALSIWWAICAALGSLVVGVAVRVRKAAMG